MESSALRHAPVPLSRALARTLAIGASVAALALAGCGRRGPLELPASAPPTQAQAAADQTNQTIALQNKDTPGLLQSPNQVYEQSAAAKQQVFVAGPAPRAINAPPVDKPTKFLLDPLL